MSELVRCDFCKVSVRNYKKHLNKVHREKLLPDKMIKENMGAPLKSKKNNSKQNKTLLLRKKGSYNSSNDCATIGEIIGGSVPFVNPVIERQPVENQHQIREQGRFGSMPLYDNMDGE